MISREALVNVKCGHCPKCDGGRFRYHPLEERQAYRGKAVVGKYECVSCGWQSGLDGELVVA